MPDGTMNADYIRHSLTYGTIILIRDYWRESGASLSSLRSDTIAYTQPLVLQARFRIPAADKWQSESAGIGEHPKRRLVEECSDRTAHRTLPQIGYAVATSESAGE